MRRFSLVIFIMAAIVAAVSSCAQREAEDTNYLEQMALDDWVLKKINGSVPDKVAVRQPDGSYVEVIHPGDQSIDYAPSDTIVWLRLEYTGRDLGNNVFVTRYESEALRQKTFTPFTHYTPDYVFCGNENYGMIAGQYNALKNGEIKMPDGTPLKLSEGSEVRLYIPSYLAFGTSGYTDDQGYGGQYALDKTKPVIEHLKVVEVIKDPVAWEEKKVVSYALDNFGMPETDTTATCFYIDTVRFNQELAIQHGGEMSLPFKKEYALTADSTAKVWFIGKFLDGFIFDTNIDTTYYRFHNRMKAEFPDTATPWKTHTVMSYTPEEDKDTELQVFYTAIKNLRRGQWSRIICTSNYAYGATGLSAALEAQQAYYNNYMSYLYSSYYSGYGYGGYGSDYGGYGSGYYDSYYNNYNNYDYYNTSISSAEEESSITTEVQPYTPLIFEFYIEVDEDEE